MTRKFSEQIASSLNEDGLFAGGIHVFDSIGSTNAWSLDQLKKGRDLPFVCIADHQSRGRGRRGRHWLSPPGANIYMSVAWQFDLPIDRLGMLSLVQAVAVIKALKRVGINDAWLKWPNDVMIDDKKIAGILIETGGIHASGCDVVTGIGLNYRMPENIPFDTDMRWTDLAHSIHGDLPERKKLISVLLNQVVSLSRKYQAGHSAFLSDIERELEALKGRDVNVHLENGEILTGAVLGINAMGELRVQVSGNERVFNSADVSLRQRDDQLEAGDIC